MISWWMIISNVLAMGERSAIGLYDVLWFLSLLGLRMGMIFAVFQSCGMMFVFIVLLYSSVSVEMAMGPRCLICVLEMLSGPVDFLGFVCAMACVTCSVVMLMGCVGSVCMCLVILR